MVRSVFLKAVGGLAAVIFSLGLGGVAFAQDATLATAVVERFHNSLIDGMKKGKELGFAGRRAKLEPVVKETFDAEAMARISTGSAWSKMSDAEHAEIVAAFTTWTVAGYAGNFAAYDGETFVTKGETPDDGKGNILVNTQLNPKGMAPVLFNYRLHKVGAIWKIFDIYLDGAVSQLAMRRAEFAAVLAKGTAADLVAHMKRLTTEADKGA